MAVGVVDFREPPTAVAERIAPDVRLSAMPGYLMWALTGRARRFAGRIEGSDPDRLHGVAMESIRRRHPDLRQLVALAEIQETIRIVIRVSVPIGPWPATRVTLLGDAIHAMSPARGDKPVVQAIADYEREMVDYGFAAVRGSTARAGLRRPVRRRKG